MKMLKNIAASSLLAAALVAPTYVSAASVGGVTWDPFYMFDFSSVSANMYQNINTTTGEATGYGVITGMNGTDSATFCGTCELTFQFGGFNPNVGGTVPTTIGQVIDYSGGWVNFYVDQTPEINEADFGSLNSTDTGDGSLWLALVGHDVAGVSLQGSVTASGLSGVGQLDVVGGMAMHSFDTDSQLDGSDLSFSNSFTTILSVGGVKDYTNAWGTGNLFGDSIPEPAPLALFGAGLLAAGFLRKRKSV